MSDVIIIGGGLGGLFCGAILAKEGYKVDVFEKNARIGGGLQSFVRSGERFDTGMHILGGFTENGSVSKLCRYLGIMDKLKLKRVDRDCMDTIHYFSDSMQYRIGEGREGFISSLAAYFPEEEENIRSYVDALYRITDGVDFFHLRSGSADLYSLDKEAFMPADELIASFTQNRKLRDILAYLNSTYGGVAGHTPSYIHALINVLYIEGTYRFVDDSCQMAQLLQQVIEGSGGNVYAANPVTHIAVEERQITHITDSYGKKHSADRYISTIHPVSLLELLDKGVFPKAYCNRLQSIPNTSSAFLLYLVLKENSVPYINHTCYCQDDYGDAWELYRYDDRWPKGLMYMTPPVSNQGEYSRKMIVVAPMEYGAVEQWSGSTLGIRPDSYAKWKEECVERMLSKLERVCKGIRGQIEHITAASPLTIRDYYNVKEGSLYGYRKDCENIMLSQVPIYTKLKNLLLSGQNINLHGVCGVALTAVNTVEALLGSNVIVNKINNI